MKILKVASWLIIIAFALVVLVVGKRLLIPIFVAVTIYFLINVLAGLFGRVRLAGQAPPYWLTTPLAATSILGVLVLVVEIIRGSVERMIKAAPVYQSNLNRLLNDVLLQLGLQEPPSLAGLVEEFDLRPLLVDIGGSISNFAGHLVLIIIYVIFLLIEQRTFARKLAAFFPELERYRRAQQILRRIGETVRTYFLVKIFTSFLTALLSYGVMSLIGLDFAIFWAFLIYLLNFIPSIGSIFATALVSLFTLLQFSEPSYFFLTLAGIGGVQLLVGNYIDPRMLGRSLNISPFIVLVSLALWGALWGIIGMFLSVPIMVTLIIILSQFQSTAPFAALLSESGRLGKKAITESEHHDFPR